MSTQVIVLSRIVLLGGLALWMSIAALNNLMDPETNRFHVGNTLSMQLLKDEPVQGIGLRWRALPVGWVASVLYCVIAYQAFVAALLWRSVYSFIHAWRVSDTQSLDRARDHGVLALTCFLLLWFIFASGGLWFGYWMKQGAIQSVHMTLILIGLGALLVIQSSTSDANRLDVPPKDVDSKASVQQSEKDSS